MTQPLRYKTGEQVLPGDVVRIGSGRSESTVDEISTWLDSRPVVDISRSNGYTNRSLFGSDDIARLNLVGRLA